MSERLTELTAADQAQVEAVLLEHGRYIESVAARFAYGRDAVPDIVQEVQLRLCQSLHGVREPRYLKTWLFKVTQNAAISMFRRQARIEHGEDAVAAITVEESVDLEALLITKDAHDRQRRVLHRGIEEVCTPRQREALRQMLAPKRVYSSKSTHSAIARARKRLRQWMQEQGYERPVTPTPTEPTP